MGKQNDKKVTREARDLLVLALGNLLESERERKHARKNKPGPKPRKTFCKDFKLVESTVAHIETGRLLGLSFAQMRPYLAALRGKDDTRFLESMKKVYNGLKEIDAVLSQF